MKSENWRSDVDHFLLMVATDACDGGCARERVIFLSEDVNSAQVDFQLAAFQALLSSILSPSSARPPCLSQALDLFRRGKNLNTQLRNRCTHDEVNVTTCGSLDLIYSNLNPYFECISGTYFLLYMPQENKKQEQR